MNRILERDTSSEGGDRTLLDAGRKLNHPSKTVRNNTKIKNVSRIGNKLQAFQKEENENGPHRQIREQGINSIETMKMDKNSLVIDRDFTLDIALDDTSKKYNWGLTEWVQSI